MKRFALILATVLIQVAVGDDLYWVKNSNWNNPSNWALGRPPCSGETASFASVPDNSVMFLNTNATVRSIVLPANGKLVLGSSVIIRFSQEVDSECKVSSNTPPMAAEIQNEFIGVRDQWWELPQNWAKDDGSPVERTPCGDDNVIFPQDSTFSFVKSNETITVRSLTVRGTSLKSLQDLQGSKEFQLKTVTINPDCASDPSLCPCLFSPTDGSQTIGTPSVGSQTGRQNVVGIAVGVLIAILFIVGLIVVVVILVVFLYVKRRGRGFGYAKDELVETPTDGEQAHKRNDNLSDTGMKNTSAFDNPIYDSELLPPTGTETAQPIGYETKPSVEEGIGFETKQDLELQFGDDFSPPDPELSKYEPAAADIAKTPDDGHKDLSEVEPKPEKEVTPVLGKYQRL